MNPVFRNLSLFLCGTSFACAAPEASAEDVAKPNVLFIFSDDQMWHSLSALEDCPVQTPNLDRLRQRGALFTHAYNMGSFSAAVCVASRTMLMTGGTLWNAASFAPKGATFKDKKAPHAGTSYDIKPRKPEGYWPAWMKAAGYETYMSGKWHVWGANVNELFDHVVDVRGGMPRANGSNYNRPFVLGEPDGWSYDGSRGGFWQGGQHWTERLGDNGVELLEKAGKSDNPFFMYLAFNAPHDPRQAPKEYLEKYSLENIPLPKSFLTEYPYNEEAKAGRGLRDERTAPFPRTENAVKVSRQEYYALITFMDHQVGRFLDALEATGKADNTYIFFTSDHGLAIGDHGFMGKQNMYDSSMRVPFLMAGPGIPANSTVAAPIYMQDALPTALEIAGANKPAQVEFHSLMPLATGETKTGNYEQIYGAYFGSQRMYRDQQYKMIVYPIAGVVRLYDMVSDPWETRDLAEGDPFPEPFLRELFTKLQQLQKDYQDPVDLSATFEAFLAKQATPTQNP